MGPSDAELIARVLTEDDRHAFATLVRRYQSGVRGLLRRMTGGNGPLADDLAQETFVRAYRSLRTYRGGASFNAWLHRIAYNLFLSEHRKAPTPRPDPALEAQQGSLASSDARHDLSRAWGVLRQEEQAALALTYGQELTQEEAAEVLGWPLGTLKTQVARGKARLKEALNAGAGKDA